MSSEDMRAAHGRAQELIHEAKKCAAELGARQLRIHDLEEECAGLQKRLDDQLDLVEWMKHALSEQAWHFRATVEALQLQYRHDVKRHTLDTSSMGGPVDAARQRSSLAFGCIEPSTGHGYAEGQRS